MTSDRSGAPLLTSDAASIDHDATAAAPAASTTQQAGDLALRRIAETTAPPPATGAAAGKKPPGFRKVLDFLDAVVGVQGPTKIGGTTVNAPTTDYSKESDAKVPEAAPTPSAKKADVVAAAPVAAAPVLAAASPAVAAAQTAAPAPVVAAPAASADKALASFAAGRLTADVTSPSGGLDGAQGHAKYVDGKFTATALADVKSKTGSLGADYKASDAFDLTGGINGLGTKAPSGFVDGKYTNGAFTDDVRVGVDGKGYSAIDHAEYKKGAFDLTEVGGVDHGAFSSRTDLKYAGDDASGGLFEQTDKSGTSFGGNGKFEKGHFSGSTEDSVVNGKLKTDSSLDFDNDKGLTAGLTETTDGKDTTLGATGKYDNGKGLTLSTDDSLENGKLSTNSSLAYDDKKAFSGALTEKTDDTGGVFGANAKYKKGNLSLSTNDSLDHGQLKTDSSLRYDDKKGLSGALTEKTDATSALYTGTAKYVKGNVTASTTESLDNGQLKTSSDFKYVDKKSGVTAGFDESSDGTHSKVDASVAYDNHKGLTFSAAAGLVDNRPQANADIKYTKDKNSIGLDAQTNDKGASFGGELKRGTSDDRFGAEADAKVDVNKGVTAGGSLHFANKAKDESFDVAASVGTNGLSASATVSVHGIKVGIVLKNLSIVMVTLDLGPKHPELNEIIQLALGVASAVVNPIPFAIGALYRLGRMIFKHNPFHHKKKDAPAVAATDAPAPTADATAAAAAAPAAVNGQEVVAVLMPNELAAMEQSGMVHADGFLNVGLSPAQFADGLAAAGLDAGQHEGLLKAYAGGDAFLPSAEASKAYYGEREAVA